jgi:hypothetical protein
MGVNSNQYLQGINQTTGTGAPVHSAVAGDRYTDTATGITYQYTTSWQTVSYSAGGLTYFTEAQNTTAPNATVPVDSLTAVSATTNADMALLPKGTGAFIVGHIPDNSPTNGGIKRGNYAVDIQPGPFNYNGGASGLASVAIGYQNQVTGNYGTSIGTGGIASGVGSLWLGGNLGGVGVASGDNSVAIQGQSRATNSYSFAIQNGNATGVNAFAGNFSTASGTNSMAMAGAQYGVAIASGTNSVAIGELSKATGNRSMAILTNADTFSHVSRLSYGSQITTGAGSPVSNVQGTVQGSTLSVGIDTSNNTPYTLGNYGGTAIPLILQNNNSIRFKGTIIARQSGSTNTSAWDIDGFIQRGTTAATTTLLISNINVVQNTPSWTTPALTANTVTGGLDIKVTGVVATSIRWTCILTTAEVIYA